MHGNPQRLSRPPSSLAGEVRTQGLSDAPASGDVTRPTSSCRITAVMLRVVGLSVAVACVVAWIAAPSAGSEVRLPGTASATRVAAEMNQRRCGSFVVINVNVHRRTRAQVSVARSGPRCAYALRLMRAVISGRAFEYVGTSARNSWYVYGPWHCATQMGEAWCWRAAGWRPPGWNSLITATYTY